MTPPETDHNDDELLAAELAFGLLDATDALSASTRCEMEPSFNAACARWKAFAAASIGGEIRTPRPSVWTSLERQLTQEHRAHRSSKPGILRIWQAATVSSASLALLLAVVLVRLPKPSVPAVPAPVLAVLTGNGSAGAVAISFDRGTGELTVLPEHLVARGRSAELWVLPHKTDPISLGVIDATRSGSRPVIRTIRRYITPGAKFAISLEPIGGSPTGKPTGAILVQGMAPANLTSIVGT